MPRAARATAGVGCCCCTGGSVRSTASPAVDAPAASAVVAITVRGPLPLPPALGVRGPTPAVAPRPVVVDDVRTDPETEPARMERCETPPPNGSAAAAAPEGAPRARRADSGGRGTPAPPESFDSGRADAGSPSGRAAAREPLRTVTLRSPPPTLGSRGRAAVAAAAATAAAAAASVAAAAAARAPTPTALRSAAAASCTTCSDSWRSRPPPASAGSAALPLLPPLLPCVAPVPAAASAAPNAKGAHRHARPSSVKARASSSSRCPSRLRWCDYVRGISISG